jgi:hypothetical protein
MRTEHSSTYDEAHRHADSLMPRKEWDDSQSDLEAVSNVFVEVSGSIGAAVKYDLGPKYPIPARVLVIRRGRLGARVQLGHCAQSRDDPDWTYELGISRDSYGWFGRLRSSSWKRIRIFSRAEVGSGDPAVIESIRLATREALKICGEAAG